MTMVERVARAIYDAADKSGSYVGDYKFHAGETTLDGTFDLAAIARAAIEAMREPTDKMIIESSRGADDFVTPAQWQYMIDAALSEGDGTK